MKTVAIVGVGLIGGSFGLALREAGFEGDLVGVSSPTALEAGLSAGAINRTASLAEAAKSADLLYLAQPVDRILSTIENIAPHLGEQTLVTDAGSTKAAIVNAAKEHLKPGSFLGGHPIAGKEQRGAGAADRSLFRGRPYVLTPSAPETAATAELRQWLVKIGAQVIDMDADEHDATVAFTSHLPQVLSTALAATLAQQKNDRLQQVFGSGLIDMTRLALSPPDLWISILGTNRTAVLAAIDAFIVSLNIIKSDLGDRKVSGSFNAAVQFASAIRKLRY